MVAKQYRNVSSAKRCLRGTENKMVVCHKFAEAKQAIQDRFLELFIGQKLKNVESGAIEWSGDVQANCVDAHALKYEFPYL